VLNPEGNAHDAHEAGEGGAEVADRQPPAGHQKPEHIADQPQRPGAQITASTQLLAVHGFLPERPEREPADHKAGARPGQPDDRDRAQQPGQPPAQGHHEPSEHNPEDVEQCADHGLLVMAERLMDVAC